MLAVQAPMVPILIQGAQHPAALIPMLAVLGPMSAMRGRTSAGSGPMMIAMPAALVLSAIMIGARRASARRPMRTANSC
jgi:hypothetical protein